MGGATETAKQENPVPVWYLILALLCVAGIAAIFLYVHPSVTSIYEEIGGELPRASQWAIGIAAKLGAIAVVFAVSLVLAVGFFLAWFTHENRLRRVIQGVFLLPVMLIITYLFVALVMPLLTFLQEV